VIDVSSRGALVEGEARLLPGTHLDVHVIARGGRTLVRSRVVRATVSEVRCDRVVYRTALAFDRPVDLPAPPSVVSDPVSHDETRGEPDRDRGTAFPGAPPINGSTWELATRPSADCGPARTDHLDM
jgi:hypothetical protein